jgi:hypothetical protein
MHLEQHLARTPPDLATGIAMRILALTAGTLLNGLACRPLVPLPSMMAGGSHQASRSRSSRTGFAYLTPRGR